MPIDPTELWKRHNRTCVLQRHWTPGPLLEICVYDGSGIVIQEFFNDDRDAAAFAIKEMHAADTAAPSLGAGLSATNDGG